MVAGYLARRTGLLPANANKGINFWIIYIALPAVSFKYLPGLQITADLWLPLVAPITVFIFGLLFVECYARIIKLDRITKSSLQLTAGLSNTSFIGFPLIIAWLGEDKLSTAVIYDQTTFLLLSSAGLIIAIGARNKGGVSKGLILKMLFTFPPFLGCLAALSIPRIVDIGFLDSFFSILAATVAPLALFSIGLQLSFEGWRSEIKTISAVLLYKLLIAPAIILIALLITGVRGDIANVSLFEAAMPVLLSAAIIAEKYRLNTKLISLIIGFSILTGFVTTAMWYFVLQYLR